ncbi:MAG: four helix bundle protein [Patescibacteria group bacterium]|nr:four helix bundle protein [Patescibacteria group bacterium]
MKNDDFKIRLYEFTLKLIKFIDALDKSDLSSRKIADQLFRSGTSIMANYVEGQSSVSTKEYTNFFAISLKSANESKYWFALLRDSGKVKSEDVAWFLSELDEISKIFGKSIVTLRKKK